MVRESGAKSFLISINKKCLSRKYSPHAPNLISQCSCLYIWVFLIPLIRFLTCSCSPQLYLLICSPHLLSSLDIFSLSPHSSSVSTLSPHYLSSLALLTRLPQSLLSLLTSNSLSLSSLVFLSLYALSSLALLSRSPHPPSPLFTHSLSSFALLTFDPLTSPPCLLFSLVLLSLS